MGGLRRARESGGASRAHRLSNAPITLTGAFALFEPEQGDLRPRMAAKPLLMDQE